MRRRETVKCQEFFTIFVQAFNRLRVFGPVFRHRTVEGFHRFFLCLGHPDLVKVRLHLALERFRHSVQHVRRLVHPTPLMNTFGIFFPQGVPKTQRPVPNGKFRSLLQSPGPQTGEDFAPARLGLAVAVLHRHQFLHTLLRGPDYYQETALVSSCQIWCMDNQAALLSDGGQRQLHFPVDDNYTSPNRNAPEL